jgi:predicted transcriptional regulator of viral defense system
MIMNKEVRGEKRREVFEMIKKAKRISLKELRASTNINYNTIRSAVISLTNAGLIERIERGIYKAE